MKAYLSKEVAMMKHEEFIDFAKLAVSRYTKNIAKFKETSYQIYVVWSCKTLQNSKVIMATSIPKDNLLYEVTLNGDTGEVYFDVYNKVFKETFNPTNITKD